MYESMKKTMAAVESSAYDFFCFCYIRVVCVLVCVQSETSSLQCVCVCSVYIGGLSVYISHAGKITRK